MVDVDRDPAPIPERRTFDVGPPTTILVGVDGSPASAHATRWVANLAASIGARVVLVHAASAVTGLINDSLPLKSSNWRQQARRRIHREWAQPLVELGVDYRTRLIEKSPGAALLDAAQDVHADLIALGIHRHRQVHSLSAHLAHHANCPVVTIPSAPGMSES